jgi:hypothetical protein
MRCVTQSERIRRIGNLFPAAALQKIVTFPGAAS